MTPFLAGVNTLGSLALGAYCVLVVGLLNDRFLASFLLPPLLFIFLICIVTGWMVAVKPNVSTRIAGLWRVTETITVLVFLFLAGSMIFGNI
jgi:hypothetical protein